MLRPYVDTKNTAISEYLSVIRHTCHHISIRPNQNKEPTQAVIRNIITHGHVNMNAHTNDSTMLANQYIDNRGHSFWIESVNEL